MTESRAGSGIDQEGSTARTESPASDPLDTNPRRRTRNERRKEFLRALRMLERIALTQADYAFPVVAQGQLAAARGRVLELFDEVIGFVGKEQV